MSVDIELESVSTADSALGGFLGFLAEDIANHPERLQSPDADLPRRICALIGNIEIDLDASLSADDE